MAPTGSAVMRATERIPDPLGIASVASVNISERCIFVRCSDLASGYQRMFWKQAFRALQSAEQSGWSSHSTVWASTPSTRQAAYAVAGDAEFGGTLRFMFPKGEASFHELISRPVVCTMFVDRSTGRFLNCSLKNPSSAAA
jgi:hypothetical protein